MQVKFRKFNETIQTILFTKVTAVAGVMPVGDTFTGNLPSGLTAGTFIQIVRESTNGTAVVSIPTTLPANAAAATNEYFIVAESGFAGTQILDRVNTVTGASHSAVMVQYGMERPAIPTSAQQFVAWRVTPMDILNNNVEVY